MGPASLGSPPNLPATLGPGTPGPRDPVGPPEYSRSLTAQHPHQTRPLIAYTASPIMPLQSTFMGAMKAQCKGQILALTDPRHLVLVALMHWPPSASGDLVDCPSTHNLDEISSWVLRNKALILDGCLDPQLPEVVYANGHRLRLSFRPEHY